MSGPLETAETAEIRRRDRSGLIRGGSRRVEAGLRRVVAGLRRVVAGLRRVVAGRGGLRRIRDGSEHEESLEIRATPCSLEMTSGAGPRCSGMTAGRGWTLDIRQEREGLGSSGSEERGVGGER